MSVMLLAGLWPYGSGAATAAARAPLQPAIVGRVADHVVRPGETLASIGARLGIDVAVLADTNHRRRNALLQPGETLVTDSRHIVPDAGAGFFINVPQRMVFLADGARVYGYPAGLGRASWPTPIGRFTVIQKERNPTWDVPISIQDEMRRAGRPVIQRVPPGPSNPLGAHFLRLSLPNLGMHGTIAPLSIYHFQSHGCIRLHADDIAELFDRVETGLTGAILYQPVLAAVEDGRAYLEVHPDIYKRAADAMAAARSQLAAVGATNVDWARVAETVKKKAGAVTDVTQEGAALRAPGDDEHRR